MALRDLVGELKPYFSTSHGLLFNVDCMKLFYALKDNTIDTIFADPPFNLGKRYSKFNDSLSTDAYLDWCYGWLDECCRVLKPRGSLFLYILPKWGFKFASYLDEKLTFRHWIAVSMKSTYRRGRRLYPAHYALLYFTKGEPRVFNRVRIPIPKCRHCGGDLKDYGGHRKHLNPRGLNLSDFWDDTSPNRHNNSKFRPHTNELSTTIIERAIKISTRTGDIVLDPFGGGGSTYQVAQTNDRLWIGAEIGDCRPIVKRLRIKLQLKNNFKTDKKLLVVFRNR